MIPTIKESLPSRSGMNKTGARILGGFAAALISWLWSGWGEPATGVPMGDAMLTSPGGAMIVIAEWVLVKEVTPDGESVTISKSDYYDRHDPG